MITIKNFRKDSNCYQPWDYRCDRANKILGNHPGEGLPRDKAIKAFKTWFEAQMTDRSKPINEVRTEMGRLYKLHKQHGKLNLWCWCTPKKCHTEIIKAMLDKAIKAASNR